ncbi:MULTISPECIES: hypothetical protein [unclassified Moorena]|nr:MULTISPECIES: hypothetical protein [unclassified Moorena]NEO11683.1 hypothetical protein [Moorena sp. SIO3E8]NEO48055.1 hypothetical protein [Moorena sp. SIO4A3]NEP99409.1 hypothetical protein [Moorena sp. SIO3F7]
MALAYWPRYANGHATRTTCQPDNLITFNLQFQTFNLQPSIFNLQPNN